MAKKGPGNTASNRVNCAAYAFISLFRDNLLIVSTKRDKPPRTRVPQAGFSVASSHTGHASCRPGRETQQHRQKGSICMRVNASTLAFSPPWPFTPRRVYVCTTMATGADPREQRTNTRRNVLSMRERQHTGCSNELRSKFS